MKKQKLSGHPVIEIRIFFWPWTFWLLNGYKQQYEIIIVWCSILSQYLNICLPVPQQNEHGWDFNSFMNKILIIGIIIIPFQVIVFGSVSEVTYKQPRTCSPFHTVKVGLLLTLWHVDVKTTDDEMKPCCENPTWSTNMQTILIGRSNYNTSTEQKNYGLLSTIENSRFTVNQ